MRSPGAAFSTCTPICAQRVEHAAHRPLGERGVADEGGLHVVGADEAHGEPRAGAGIAEIERCLGLQQRSRCRCRGSPIPRRASRCGRPSPSWPSPVRITSSPSSRPVMRVSPDASPPNMKERCEIDLSPGTRAASGKRRRAARGGWNRFVSLRHILAFRRLNDGQDAAPCLASGLLSRVSAPVIPSKRAYRQGLAGGAFRRLFWL